MAGSACLRRLFGAVRTFKGFTPRPDPFQSLYEKGTDLAALQQVKDSAEKSLVLKLTKLSNGVIGAQVQVLMNGARVDVTKREPVSRILPRFKLVDQIEAEEIIANTTSRLALDQQRPEPHVLPESKVIRKEPMAANKRFTFAFVDTSAGHSYATRPVVLRMQDGTLRTADPQERDRFLLSVFPDGNKKLRLPPKFDEANLPSMLSDNMHAEVLDEVCDLMYSHQPDYVRVHRAVYEDIESRQIYSVLQDTIHFRDFFLFLIREKRIDSLLCALLRSSRLDDATGVLGLFLGKKPSIKALEEYAIRSDNSQLNTAMKNAIAPPVPSTESVKSSSSPSSSAAGSQSTNSSQSRPPRRFNPRQ